MQEICLFFNKETLIFYLFVKKTTFCFHKKVTRLFKFCIRLLLVINLIIAVEI